MPGAQDAGEFRNGQRVRITKGTMKRLRERTTAKKKWPKEYIRPERDYQKFRVGEGRYKGKKTNMQIAAVKVWDVENEQPGWGWIHCGLIEDDPEVDDEDKDSLEFTFSDESPEKLPAVGGDEGGTAEKAGPRTDLPSSSGNKRQKVDNTPHAAG